CSNAVRDGGAERARQIVIGSDEHLLIGYQPAHPAPLALLVCRETPVSPRDSRVKGRFCRPAGVLGFLAYRRQEVKTRGRTTGSVRTVVDRGGGRLVRVSRDDSGPVGAPIQGGRAL